MRITTTMTMPFAVLMTAMLIGLVSQKSNAVPLTDLLDGQSIVAVDNLFDQWFLRTDASSAILDLASIDVVALVDQPDNPGLMFTTNGALSVVDNARLDLHFGFTVSTLDGGARIKDSSLAIDAFSSDRESGTIQVLEEIFDPPGALLGTSFVEADLLLGNFGLVDSADFAPQAMLSVQNTILLTGDNSGDFVSLDIFNQRFSQSPRFSQTVAEPGTLALIGIGLIVLALCWRRRRDG